MLECLYLGMNGVPFEVAWGLGPSLRLAFVVAIGTLRGRVFDWERMEWRE